MISRPECESCGSRRTATLMTLGDARTICTHCHRWQVRYEQDIQRDIERAHAQALEATYKALDR